MAVWIEERVVKLRRATRHDLAALATLLECSIDPRFGRRTVADLGADVYVAEHARDGVVGVVGVSYRRSLAAGRFVAEVAPLASRDPTHIGALLDFAAARARRRGCHELIVCVALAPDADAALDERGWSRRTVRVGVVADPG
jgi:N-acetylglutamate synthase-like GNAT family acetyltransferase